MTLTYCAPQGLSNLRIADRFGDPFTDLRRRLEAAFLSGQRVPPAPASVLGAQFDEIVALRMNWDGEGALKPHPHVLQIVEVIMQELANVPTQTTPQLVPTLNGGAQFEWHGEDADLVIEVAPTGQLNVYARDIRTGFEDEGPLASLQTKVAELLTRFR